MTASNGETPALTSELAVAITVENPQIGLTIPEQEPTTGQALNVNLAQFLTDSASGNHDDIQYAFAAGNSVDPDTGATLSSSGQFSWTPSSFADGTPVWTTETPPPATETFSVIAQDVNDPTRASRQRGYRSRSRCRRS